LRRTVYFHEAPFSSCLLEVLAVFLARLCSIGATSEFPGLLTSNSGVLTLSLKVKRLLPEVNNKDGSP